jgi:hypothetical protein
MLIAIALLALVLPSRMIAAASMILGDSGRGERTNGDNSENATKNNHTCFPIIGAQCFALIQVR